MPRPSELIPIGEFARRSRLSVKQLRSYDELGLLAPAYVDPDSGYRYYHRGQARTAITIALLRSLQVPLGDVHDLLVAEPDRVAGQLARQRLRIEGEVERGLRTLRSLDRLLQGDDLLPYRVQEREEPAVVLVGLWAGCPGEDLDREVPETIAALAERVPASDFAATPAVGRYPLDLEGEVSYFVGIQAGAAGDAEGLEALSLPATRVAATVHAGSYDEMRLAYYPLLAQVEEHGGTPGSFVQEVYLDAPPAVPVDRARTEVLTAVLRRLAPDVRKRSRRRKPMNVRTIYPVLMTDRLEESRRFYAALLDLDLAFDSDWFAQLISAGTDQAQMGLVAGDHDSIPAAFRGRPGTGLLSRSRWRTSTPSTSAPSRKSSRSSCRCATRSGDSATSSSAIRTGSPSTSSR